MTSFDVHFEHVGLTVKIEARDGDWTKLSDGHVLVSYRIGEPALLTFEDGEWKTPEQALNESARTDTTQWLLLRPGLAADFEAIDGAIDVSNNIEEDALEQFLGTELRPQGSNVAWLGADGLIVHVLAATALPGAAGYGTLPALFRRNGAGWEWRLLDHWPRKLQPSQNDVTLRSRLSSVFEAWVADLPFLGPFDASPFSLRGEEGTISQTPGAGSSPQQEIEPIFTPFTGPSTGYSPAWCLGLTRTRLELIAPPLDGEARGVLTDAPSLEELELRPSKLELRPEHGSCEYCFIEGRPPGTPPGGFDLEIALRPQGAEGGLAAQIVFSKASDLAALQPGEGAVEQGNPELWLRETQGFARIVAANAQATWPRSAIRAETRDVKLSAWLDHANGRYLDLSLLLDNSTCTELALCHSDGRWTARLRVWGPALRITLGRHASLGLEQPHRELPPFEDASSRSVFHPLVLLSQRLTSNAETAPFLMSLRVAREGALELQLRGVREMTRWRQLPLLPTVGPSYWASNDPLTSLGLSALRGLVPFVSKAQPSLRASGGALEVNVPDDEAPTLLMAENEVLAVVEPLNLNLEVAPELGTLHLRRRGSISVLDHHWRRSVPKSSADANASPEVPVELTWVRDRVVGKRVVSAPELLSNTNLPKVEASVPSSREEHLAHARLDWHQVQAGAVTLCSLAVWLDKSAKLHAWTACAPAGGSEIAFATREWAPSQLTLGANTAELQFELRSGDASTSEKAPFASPGFIRFGLRRNEETGPLLVDEVDGSSRVAFSGAEFVRLLRPDLGGPTNLIGVESKRVSLDVGRTGIVLRDLRYRFSVSGEVFNVATDQTMTLPFDGTTPTLSAGTDTGRLVAPETDFRFTLKQALPGLVLEETLLALGAGDKAQRGPTLTLPDGTKLPAVRVGAGWEFCLASKGIRYAAPLSLGATIGIEVQSLTRVYLRLERLRELSSNGRAFHVVHAVVGWLASRVFGLAPIEDNTPPQVTLRCSGDKSARSSPSERVWDLALNGRVAVSAQHRGNSRLESELTFWDGIVSLTERNEELALSKETTPIPALFSGALTLRDDEHEWCAFLTARLLRDAAHAPRLRLTGTFSVEPTDMTAPRGLAFRRPDIKLHLWDFQADAVPSHDRALVVHIDFDAHETGEVQAVSDDRKLAATTGWTSFYFGPSAQLAATTDGKSAFPGGDDWASVPAAGGDDDGPSVQVFGKRSTVRDGRFVGYTLFQRGDQPTTWLRCPVASVDGELDPLASLPCVWIWSDGRLQKLWIEEQPAEGVSSRELAKQVLAFSRWHEGAILESSGPTWELLDSPLLNLSLSLDPLTGRRNPTDDNRFAERDRSQIAAPLHKTLSTAKIRVEAAKLEVGQHGNGKLLAPHLTAIVTMKGAIDTVSLSRSIPFELDSEERDRRDEQEVAALNYYHWPVVRLAPPQAPAPAPPRALLPHPAADMALSVYTPRPGEKVAHRVTAAGADADGIVLSDVAFFSERTPLGKNEERNLELAREHHPEPACLYRDHLTTVRLSWERNHPDPIEAAQGKPALALHSPEVVKEVTRADPLWLRVALHEADRALPVRWYALLTPVNAEPNPVTLHIEIANTGETIERKGCGFVLHLASPLVNDPEPLRDHSLRLSIVGDDKAKEWRVAIGKDERPPAPVDRVISLNANEVTAWRAKPQATGDSFKFVDAGAERAAKPLPVLLGLFRKDSGNTRLVAFGPDTQSWEPSGSGATIQWRKRGQHLDRVPLGSDRSRYELLLIHPDGSSHTIPKPPT